jgi:hypothetical protein
MINGTYVALERLLEVKNIKIIPDFKYKPIFYYLFVLHMDIITWILFFTKDISTAFTVITKILTLKEGSSLLYLESGIYTGVFVLIFHIFEEYSEKIRISTKFKNSLVPILSILIYLFIISKGGSNIDFYYTKF